MTNNDNFVTHVSYRLRLVIEYNDKGIGRRGTGSVGPLAVVASQLLLIQISEWVSEYSRTPVHTHGRGLPDLPSGEAPP